MKFLKDTVLITLRATLCPLHTFPLAHTASQYGHGGTKPVPNENDVLYQFRRCLRVLQAVIVSHGYHIVLKMFCCFKLFGFQDAV
jgi:hypothetical protein